MPPEVRQLRLSSSKKFDRPTLLKNRLANLSSGFISAYVRARLIVVVPTAKVLTVYIFLFGTEIDFYILILSVAALTGFSSSFFRLLVPLSGSRLLPKKGS